MCLGFPGKIEKLDGIVALIDVAGTKREISMLYLMDEDINVGDWVEVHAGFAISKMDAEKAEETLEFLLDYTSQDDEIYIEKDDRDAK